MNHGAGMCHRRNGCQRIIQFVTNHADHFFPCRNFLSVQLLGQMFEQVQLMEVTANAGQDKVICAGDEVIVGELSITTEPEIQYNWNIISGDGLLATTNTSQIIVAPTVNSVYELVITGPGGCPSRDTVNVTVIAPPVAGAGSDLTICEGTLATVGTPGIANYQYYWRSLDDGNYLLDNNLLAQPTYDGRICPPGASTSYLLSVVDDSFVCPADYDTLTIHVVRAEAGYPDLRCAPTYLGEPKPNSDFDYLWTVTSGDAGSISPGTETDSIIYVSPSLPTDYQLAVTSMGQTCYDSVRVELNCGVCERDSVAIQVQGDCDGRQFLQDIAEQNVLEISQNRLYGTAIIAMKNRSFFPA